MEERREEYDPGRVLTWAALLFVTILIVFVCFIIGVQIMANGEANTESWAALTGIIGWATAQVQVLYSNRFGSTLSNTKKDAAIARMAEAAPTGTAAAVAANVAATAAATPGATAALIPVVVPAAATPAAQPQPQPQPGGTS